MSLLLALHVSTLGYTLPGSSSSLHPSIRPPTIFCALDVTALPPAGFVWGESFVFDEDATATSPTIAPSVVQSWYDAGVRLDTPKESLRRSRLNAPAETETRTEFSKGFSIEDLTIKERIGVGTQSDVLLGELPGYDGPVAVKVGLKLDAIDREATVLSAMSDVPGFPTVLHREAVSPSCPGGFIVLGLLGPSLEDLWTKPNKDGDESKKKTQRTRAAVSEDALLLIGRAVLRLLRKLHYAGFVHNDVKPANVLLGANASLQPTRLHLIDFGSCWNIDGTPIGVDYGGPIGTANYASVAAEERLRSMRPADDVESLAYTLSYLSRGSLPWQHFKSDDEITAMKRELLIGDYGGSGTSAAKKLSEGVKSATAAKALEALWAEVRRCEADLRAGTWPHSGIDYDACLEALGGEPFSWSEEEADGELLSELAFMNALGGGGEEAADVRGVVVPTNAAAVKQEAQEADIE